MDSDIQKFCLGERCLWSDFLFGWELFVVKMELADLLNGRKGLKRPAAKRAAHPNKQPKKRPAAVGTRDGHGGDGDGSSNDVEIVLLLDWNIPEDFQRSWFFKFWKL